MPEQIDTDTLSRVLRPMSGKMSLELLQALASVRADEEMQRRYDYLADAHTEGKLTPAEHVELESIVQANSILSVLKAEAQARLEEREQ